MAVRECLPCMVLLKIIIKVQCSTNNSVFLYTKHMDTELQTPQLNVLFLKWSVSQPKWGQLFSWGAWAPSRPTGWTCARPSAPVCHSIPTPMGSSCPWLSTALYPFCSVFSSLDPCALVEGSPDHTDGHYCAAITWLDGPGHPHSRFPTARLSTGRSASSGLPWAARCWGGLRQQLFHKWWWWGKWASCTSH